MWSKDKPCESGWYFVKDSDNSVEIVLITSAIDKHLIAWFVGDEDELSLKADYFDSCEFAPAIPKED